MVNLTLVLIVALAHCHCSLHRVGVRAASGLLQQASEEMETESNWVMFRDGVPANLKMLEGLLYVDPDNRILLSALVKGYASYGYGVHETLYLPEKLATAEATNHRNLAVANYRRALKYGIRSLKLAGFRLDEFRQALLQDRSLAYLDAIVDGRASADQELVFFTGQAWSSLINLQRDNPQLLIELNLAKAFFDWSCGHNPNIQFGSCKIFYGSYETSRPKMLGGRPEVGREIFIKAIEAYPDNIMLSLAYIENYVIPRFQTEEFRRCMRVVANKIRNLESSVAVSVEAREDPNKRLRLLNAIAKKRFEIIRAYQQELF